MTSTLKYTIDFSSLPSSLSSLSTSFESFIARTITFCTYTHFHNTPRTCVKTEVKMSAALVAAWVGAFVAPVCIELLKIFEIHKGWSPPHPAPSSPHDETIKILGEIRD